MSRQRRRSKSSGGFHFDLQIIVPTLTADIDRRNTDVSKRAEIGAVARIHFHTRCVHTPFICGNLKTVGSGIIGGYISSPIAPCTYIHFVVKDNDRCGAAFCSDGKSKHCKRQ